MEQVVLTGLKLLITTHLGHLLPIHPRVHLPISSVLRRDGHSAHIRKHLQQLLKPSGPPLSAQPHGWVKLTVTSISSPPPARDISKDSDAPWQWRLGATQIYYQIPTPPALQYCPISLRLHLRLTVGEFNISLTVT